MPKIIHYRNNCIGCNSCVELDSCNWKISDEDGKSDLQEAKKKDNGVYVKEITDFEKEDSEKAADACPVGIIKVEE